MAHSPPDIERLKDRIDIALVGGRLSAWQRKFLVDIGERIEKYGPDTRLSAKQLDKLLEVLADGRPSPKTVAFAPPRSDGPSPRWRRHRSGPLAREGRRLANRFVRDFAFAAALTAGFLIYSYVEQMPGGFGTGLFVASGAPGAVPINRSQFRVTDGDTIHLNGEARGIRLVGFNTPEIFHPGCADELALGRRASARLKELLTSVDLELERVSCACPAGREGTGDCNHGRGCGILFVDGRDVGDLLISEGLAVPFICAATSCPPTPRPWCG